MRHINSAVKIRAPLTSILVN